jgi:hypothetical protein
MPLLLTHSFTHTHTHHLILSILLSFTLSSLTHSTIHSFSLIRSYSLQLLLLHTLIPLYRHSLSFTHTSANTHSRSLGFSYKSQAAFRCSIKKYSPLRYSNRILQFLNWVYEISQKIMYYPRQRFESDTFRMGIRTAAKRLVKCYNENNTNNSTHPLLFN